MEQDAANPDRPPAGLPAPLTPPAPLPAPLTPPAPLPAPLTPPAPLPAPLTPPAPLPAPVPAPVPDALAPVAAEDFELVAASLRADAADLATFVEVLASKLEAALPGRVQVERHAKKLFSHDKVVTRITIDFGEVRYSLTPGAGGDLDCGRAKAVRGIVLKTERLGLPDWIEALARDLAAQARTSEQTRLALERLLT